MMLFPRTWSLVVLVLAASPLHAGDWYVDAVGGSNANSGVSPAQAWKTVTYAMWQVPAAGADTLHIAPGVHDTALGESFPWRIREQLSLRGAGPGQTFVDGGGMFQLVLYESASWAECWNIDTDTVLEGLTLRNAGAGVFCYSDCGQARPTLRDLEVTGMTSVGISATNDFAFGGAASLRGERLWLHGNGRGASSSVSGALIDCDISNNVSEGVFVSTSVFSNLVLTRCTLLDNGLDGIRVRGGSGGANATLEDCLVARNGRHGVWSEHQSCCGTSSVDLFRCTVVGNVGTGLEAGDPGPVGTGGSGFIHAESTIVFGNGDDINGDETTGQVTAAWCDVGDGDFAGSNGNFSAPPMFRDFPGGDYRLSWGSPCAETGDPATPAGVLDLDGLARNIDGDLDTVEAPDLGAFELAPLWSASTGQLGTLLELQMTAQVGAPLTLLWSRKGTVPPAATIFGQFDLDPAKAKVFLTGQVGLPGTLLYKRKIPNTPFLVGRTFAWQALVDSPAAPGGKAYTSAVEITIVP